MDRLVEETLKYGLVPPVVIEFPGITVGGGYSGTSGDSSSFKHGFLDKTISYVEMVLANGDVVKISPTEKADLFHGAASAVGTFDVHFSGASTPRSREVHGNHLKINPLQTPTSSN
jgi:FAD/FMN-containing dehydrogenase